MYNIKATKQFKKDYKKLDNSAQKEVQEIIDKLKNNTPLPKHNKDHSLSGKLKGLRDCHVRPDLILIYSRDKKIKLIKLIRVGNHSNLQLSSFQLDKNLKTHLNEKNKETSPYTNIKSNGIYSLNTGWVKHPVQQDIPDIDMEEFEKEFKKWEDRYFDLLNKLNK